MDKIIAQRIHAILLPDHRQITATSKLIHYTGNQRPYFSVTGEVRNLHRYGDNQIEMIGAIHDLIVDHFPYLAPVVRVHLADDTGWPMHAVENAIYFAGLPSYSARPSADEIGWPEALARHLRVSVPEARAIRAQLIAASDPIQPELLKQATVLACHTLAARWLQEAVTALIIINDGINTTQKET